jgi:hypothetical protein
MRHLFMQRQLMLCLFTQSPLMLYLFTDTATGFTAI